MSGVEEESVAVPLARRTVLVSGVTSGIGHAVAERLLAAGTRVIGLGRALDKAPQGERLTTVAVDLADLDALPAALEELARRFPEVDAVVANAGAGRFGSLEELSFAQIRRQIDLNLTSHIFLSRVFLPRLKTRGGGDLVLIGSETALAGGRRGAVYTAAKSGVRGLARALRLEAAKAGVRVSVVHPGMVRTPFFDEQSFAPGEAPENALEPEEVAEVVVSILSARPGVVFDEVSLSPLTRVLRSRR